MVNLELGGRVGQEAVPRYSGHVHVAYTHIEWVDWVWALSPVVGLPCCRPAACDRACDGTLISSPQRWFGGWRCEGVLPLEHCVLDPKLPLMSEWTDCCSRRW